MTMLRMTLKLGTILENSFSGEILPASWRGRGMRMGRQVYLLLQVRMLNLDDSEGWKNLSSPGRVP